MNMREHMTEDEMDFLMQEIRRVSMGILAQRAGIIPPYVDVHNANNAVAMRRYINDEMNDTGSASEDSTGTGSSGGHATAGSPYHDEFNGSDGSSHFSDAMSDDCEWQTAVGEHCGWRMDEVHVEHVPNVLQGITMHCLADYTRHEDLELELAWNSWARQSIDHHPPHSIGANRAMHVPGPYIGLRIETCEQPWSVPFHWAGVWVASFPHLTRMTIIRRHRVHEIRSGPFVFVIPGDQVFSNGHHGLEDLWVAIPEAFTPHVVPFWPYLRLPVFPSWWRYTQEELSDDGGFIGHGPRDWQWDILRIIDSRQWHWIPPVRDSRRAGWTAEQEHRLQVIERIQWRLDAGLEPEHVRQFLPIHDGE